MHMARLHHWDKIDVHLAVGMVGRWGEQEGELTLMSLKALPAVLAQSTLSVTQQ